MKDKVKVFCPRCGGKKKLVMKKYPANQGRAWVACPECGGSGWIEVVFIENVHTEVFIP